MKKYIVYGFTACMIGSLLTGCGETLPDMTAEQEAQITEYAVETYLKYSKGNGRLVVEELEQAEENGEELFAPEPEPEAEENSEEVQPWETEPEPEETEEEEKPVFSTISMDEFMGLQGVSLDYSGYKVTNAYPADSDNAYFSMTASAGKKLLVLEFELKNTGNDAVIMDLNRVDVNFSFSDNGGKKYKLQHTMVENDIYAYSGSLEPGESKTIAGIVEMPAEEAERISIPTLTMAKGDEKETILLD